MPGEDAIEKLICCCYPEPLLCPMQKAFGMPGARSRMQQSHSQSRAVNVQKLLLEAAGLPKESCLSLGSCCGETTPDLNGLPSDDKR